MALFNLSNTQTIGFIGAGNMAQALVGSLVTNGYPAENISLASPSREKLQQLQQRWGVKITTDNKQLANNDVLVLAIKPQVAHEVCSAIAANIKQYRPLIISVVAGVPIIAYERMLGKELAIIRCMPNMPALINLGATGLYASNCTSAEQRYLAEQLLRAVGITAWVDTEAQIDIITGLSGSGPAYFFYMMEALESAAIAAGLPADIAHPFILQTVKGAASLAQQRSDSLAVLRRQVTSPNGTTEQALQVLQQRNVEEALGAALKAAELRAKELGKELIEKL